jgi:hypothetical protein
MSDPEQKHGTEIIVYLWPESQLCGGCALAALMDSACFSGMGPAYICMSNCRSNDGTRCHGFKNAMMEGADDKDLK